jgi:hypothetical protein
MKCGLLENPPFKVDFSCYKPPFIAIFPAKSPFMVDVPTKTI